VRPDFGPGPLKAVEAYLAANPAKLVLDAVRESKFGCTFAFRGYYKVFVNE
jgi:cephalosporin hydroxylase